MSFVKKHFIFWGLPTLYSLLVMGLYFSGSDALVDWVAPRTNTQPWTDYGNRELGLLENAQHLVLLISICVLFWFYPRATHFLQRAGTVCGVVVIGFMFFEEIDYGSHYWDWITSASRFEGEVNFHNTTGHTNRMKQAVDLVMVVWFVFLPILAPVSKSAWLKYFAAPRLIVLTVVAAVVVSKFAHALDDRDLAVRTALSNNISEFRELFTYYIWLLYCWIMVKRPWPGTAAQTDHNV